MQAQYDTYYSSHLSSGGYCHPVPNTYSTIHADSSCAPGGVDDFSGSFSRGSSLEYLHEDYRYMVDPGESPCPNSGDSIGSSFTSSSTTYGHALPSTHMTNIGFSGASAGYNTNTNGGGTYLVTYGHAGEVPAFYHQDQRWEWNYHTLGEVAVGAPIRPQPHVYPYQPTLLHLPNNTAGTITPGGLSLHDADVSLGRDLMSTIKSAAAVVEQQPQTYPPASVRSLTPTTAQVLPMSPATAVSSSPDGQRNYERTSRIVAGSVRLPRIQPSASTPSESPVRVAPRVASVRAMIPDTEVLSREKKHACTMCHKRSAGIK